MKLTMTPPLWYCVFWGVLFVLYCLFWWFRAP